MADLADGDLLRSIPPTVADTQDPAYTCTITSFGTAISGGEYDPCGVAFVAWSTGRASIEFAADLDNSSSSSATSVAPAVREGPVIGEGAVIQTAELAVCVRNVGDENRRFGAYLLLEGLTPWRTYNVLLEHRVSGGIGGVKYRHLIVAPET